MDDDRPVLRSDSVPTEDLAKMQVLVDYWWDTGGKDEVDTAVANEEALVLDRIIYGESFVTVDGVRINPRTVSRA